MWLNAGTITPDKDWGRIDVVINQPKEVQLVYNTNWVDWNEDRSLRSYGALRFYSPELEGVIGYYRLYPTQLNQVVLIPDRLQLLDLFVEVRHFSYLQKNYWKSKEELIWSVDVNFRW